jgi:NAD-dependent dihydropyrimidine dehydrogenase PreA subunit
MGRFIEVAIDPAAVGEVAGAIVRQCPVDIYALDGADRLVSRPEREDECILCGRCVALAPEGVTVRRAYGARRPVAAAAGGGSDG